MILCRIGVLLNSILYLRHVDIEKVRRIFADVHFRPFDKNILYMQMNEAIESVECFRPKFVLCNMVFYCCA
jgi:hypothetical protein